MSLLFYIGKHRKYTGHCRKHIGKILEAYGKVSENENMVNKSETYRKHIFQFLRISETHSKISETFRKHIGNIPDNVRNISARMWSRDIINYLFMGKYLEH